MRKVFDIGHIVRNKIRTILMLFFVLLLCGCGDEDGCDPIQKILNGPDGVNCLFCPFFKTLTKVAGEMSDAVWRRYAPDLGKVVLIASAIYIAWNVLKMVGAFGKKTADEFLTSDKSGLFKLMFKMFIIYFCLVSPTLAFQKYVLFPLLKSSIEIGTAITDGIGIDAAGMGATEIPTWRSIFEVVNQAARDFNDSIYFIVALGQAMDCQATLGLIFGWDIYQWIYGTILFIFGWLLLVGVSFYIIDIIIQLSFAAVLLPVGVACAASHLTTNYTKNIWNQFLNVFFNFILLGIILSLTLKVVAICVGNSGAAPSSPLSSYQFDLPAAIDANELTSITTAFGKFGYLVLTIVCLSVMVNLVRQMDTIARKLSGATGFAPAAEASAAIGQAATKPLKQVMNYTGNLGKQAAGAVGHDIARAARLDKLYKWGGNRVGAMQGNLTGTGRQGYKAFWRKQNFSNSLLYRGGAATGRGIRALWNKLR